MNTLSGSPRIAVVGVPGAWSSEQLANAVADRTGWRCLLDLSHTRLDLEAGALWHGDLDLTSVQAVIVKKIGADYAPHSLDLLELLRFLEGKGVRVFSPAASIQRHLSRMGNTMTLRLGGVPMPPTTVTASPTEALAALQTYGEAVFKPMFSTKARGMAVFRAGEHGLEDIVAYQAAGNPVLYLQKKLALPGRDLGIAYLGGRYLGAYARVSSGESWNSTILAGGRYEQAEPGEGILALADQAQKLFGLSFTGVDVVETEAGPQVFEVSAFGGFRGLKEGCGIDAAGAYADHVLQELKST